MSSLALIRSAGLQLVKAANEGRTVIDMFPKEKVSEDFRVLAERVVGAPAATQSSAPRVTLVSLFGRLRESART
jgi:Flp pilus assembly CpaE family ATPase